jgi:hypothetical protein
VRAVIGIVAAGVFLGGVAAVVLCEAGAWMSPGGAEAATDTKAGVKSASVVKASETVKPSDATAIAAKPQASNTAKKPVTPKREVAAKPATGTVTAAAHPVESLAVRRIRGTAETPAAIQTATQVEDQIHYQYNVIGRRDPFTPMVDNFIGDDVGGDAPVDVGGVKVVGIVWGADSFALVEDARGNSLVLRRGDKVMNGFVEELKRDAMIVKLTVDGQSQSVAIPLTRRGDQSNASR